MNRQTSENRYQKRRKSLSAGEERVILQPTEMRRFHLPFLGNPPMASQALSNKDGKPAGVVAVSRDPTARPSWVGRRSVAWGETDPETGVIVIYREDDRPWFAMDMRTGKALPLDYGPMEPEGPEPTPQDWAAVLHAFADKAETVSVCYFIGADEGPIKIGHSVNVRDRLKAMQSGCPVILSVLATVPGGEARETAYHTQFAETRLHGEWFERTPAPLAEIGRVLEGDGL